MGSILDRFRSRHGARAGVRTKAEIRALFDDPGSVDTTGTTSSLRRLLAAQTGETLVSAIGERGNPISVFRDDPRLVSGKIQLVSARDKALIGDRFGALPPTGTPRNLSPAGAVREAHFDFPISDAAAAAANAAAGFNPVPPAPGTPIPVGTGVIGPTLNMKTVEPSPVKGGEPMGLASALSGAANQITAALNSEVVSGLIDAGTSIGISALQNKISGPGSPSGTTGVFHSDPAKNRAINDALARGDTGFALQIAASSGGNATPALFERDAAGNITGLEGVEFGSSADVGSAVSRAFFPTISKWTGEVSGARAGAHLRVNPVSGKPTWFGPLGDPVLWSRDFAASRKVSRLARKAARRKR